MLLIELPWPDRILSPNSRAHHMARAKVAREARARAKIETGMIYSHAADLLGFNSKGNLPLRLTFCFPDERKRDSDNLLTMCKPYRDGIADALGLDDRRFWPVTLERGKNIPGGKVIFRVG